MIVVDAHEDIAWNIRTFGRDYTRSALWLRQQEAGTAIPGLNGNALLGRSEWLLGRVGVVFATLFEAPMRRCLGGWDTQCYEDQPQACEMARAQLDVYERLADETDLFRLLLTRGDLDEIVASWGDDMPFGDRRIGLLMLMEGADPILEPQQVEEWYASGVRAVGPAWNGTHYAGGTHEPGPFTAEGLELLDVMGNLGMILDLSHLAEEAFYQAVDRYEGVVMASHSNPRRFCPTDRGLSDEMIARLIERDGVVGIVPYNAFLKPGWRQGDRKDEVTLADVADAVDHVCQIAGSAQHVGIGSDFDGGFGVEHTPQGVDTVADLLTLRDPLAARGYTAAQIDDILGGNWLRLLGHSLPD
jgi:membrane dipeptidase